MPTPNNTKHSIFLLLLGSAIILAVSLGVRHAFGLFLNPMSLEFGWGREIFAFAIAMQNLVWGVAQPFVGMFADRYGTRITVIITASIYALGLFMMAHATDSSSLIISSGLLIGFGLSGTSFPILLSAVGRSVAPEKRSMAMGIASAAGSFGQFAMLPGTLGLIEWLGWSAALLVCAVLVALLLPVSWMLRESVPSGVATAKTSVAAAFKQAARHTPFWLLCMGYLVCGFQVVFIGVHLPSYLLDQQLSAQVGTAVLALVGLFNIAGTWTAGWLGGRYSKPRLLVWIYLLRTVVISLFVFLPVSALSAYLFGIAMGLLWLSTVPLTNGTIATLFGVRHLSMLTGIAFLFHQLGSFVGGWLGGWGYDVSGSYDMVWYVSIALSLIAAALNWSIRELPVEESHA